MLMATAAATSSPLASLERPALPTDDAPPIFRVPSPIGTLDYRARRGLRVGDTGLALGGFSSAVGEILDGGERHGGLDSLNFLVSYYPLSFLHLFSEIELTEPLVFERGQEGVRAEAVVGVNRLYADLSASDAINLRLGQFLTPIGRWNLAPADPLVWTTSEPLLVEEVFDDTVKGAMVFGTLFAPGQTLSYSLYGMFFNPITPDPDAPEPDRAGGGHFDWTGTTGSSVGVSYALSQQHGREPWRSLFGVDGFWLPHDRVEVMAEALFGEGARLHGAVAGFYVQGVVETARTLYAIVRIERFDPEHERAVDLLDVGVAWVPKYYLRFKADYQFADHVDERSPPGARFSFSVLF